MAMKSLLQIVLVVWAALAAAGGPGHAAEIGQIKNIAGQVFLLRNNNQQPAKAGDLLEQADVLITGANGSVGVTLIDNSRLSAGPNSSGRAQTVSLQPNHPGRRIAHSRCSAALSPSSRDKSPSVRRTP